MKITKVSTTQFAGISDREISFDDGINLIYGKNESGKSTLVNLILKTLFQSNKVAKADKEIIFPSERRTGEKGDFADGTVTLETENGKYVISKTWGEGKRCVLSTPTGKISNFEKAGSILSDVLTYGEGVYSEILLSSQVGADLSLQTILDEKSSNDAAKEIIDVVSKAFLESGGISIDEIGDKIDEMIAGIEGKDGHWDRSRDIPEKNKLWKRGIGEIHNAYYALEEAKEALRNLSKQIEIADEKAELYAHSEAEVKKAEAARAEFEKYYELLNSRNRDKKDLERVKRELEELKKVREDWPIKEDLLSKAKKMRDELADRAVVDKYESAKAIADEIEKLEEQRKGKICPTESEIRQAKTAKRSIEKLENKLCGMNLTAVIDMFGGSNIYIRSVRTGELIDIHDNKAVLNESVIITIPNVMEMQLSPANVNAAVIKAEIEEHKSVFMSVLDKYAVKSVEELEKLRNDLLGIDKNIDNMKAKLQIQLGNESYESVKAAAEKIKTPVRSKSDIEREIRTICSSDIDRFIIKIEEQIKRYLSDHGSITKLEQKCSERLQEREKIEKSLALCDDIPAEFESIDDPESYRKKLDRIIEEKRNSEKEAIQESSNANASVDVLLSDKTFSDYEEKCENAQRRFDEQKTLLHHWLHIKDVYEKLKQNYNNNPVEGIGNSFLRYLGIITDGRIQSELPDIGKLNMRIYSNDNLLDFSKLSEGSKETVSLAFRLAVLDHLFPEGGGVIVFDDPFANMDIDRTARSCELIKECAKKHQVIFLTCDNDIGNMLGAEPKIIG